MATELTERRPFPDFGEMRHRTEGGVLTVSGEHEESSEAEDESYLRRERRYGSFSRSMTLPRGVDAEAIEATTEDGVLEVRIPLPAAEGRDAVEIRPTAKGG